MKLESCERAEVGSLHYVVFVNGEGYKCGLNYMYIYSPGTKRKTAEKYVNQVSLQKKQTVFLSE